VNDLLLHSTKYDGSLHYRYAVAQVQRTDDRLIAFSSPGSPVESYRGSWTGTKHLLSTFWKGRAYVLHVRWDVAWTPEFLYVDIATGTKWDDRVVRYVDLDLDLILRHGSTNIYLDDEDEFEANRLRWKYPAELVKNCHGAAGEVRRLLEWGEKPFSTALFAWRPGSPVDW
jgi:protein associated with RNAse G/E